MGHRMQPLIDFIQTHESFVVVGHEDPDGDCLCSQLAIDSLLRRMGKLSCLVSPGPFARSEIVVYQKRFETSLARAGANPEAAIVVDCSTAERTGSIAEEISGLPTAILDHHVSGIPHGTVRIIDPSAPSVTFLFLELLDALGERPTPEEADWLLFGLCTDTGFFRHLGEGTVPAFNAVARLVDAGASTKSVYYRMFGNRSFESRKLLGRLLERSESYCDGRLIVTTEELGDIRDIGPENRDSDTLYRELQSVAGCEVVVLVREENDQECSVGLRSLDAFDVGSLARTFGGGGHRNASGYTACGRAQTVRERIISEIVPLLSRAERI